MQQIDSSFQTAFDSMTTADARYLSSKFYISWLRQTSSNSFGVVGTSTVNNTLVRGEPSSIAPVDTYDFFDETNSVVSLEYQRAIQEPTGGVGYAIANVELENTSKRFIPNYDSTIGTALLPNRPMKMHFGFNIKSTNKLVPVFKGLTKDVREYRGFNTLKISGYDYLSYIDEYKLDTTIYQDQRSDQIIADILQTIGIGTAQYSLDTGLNTIGFAWFNKTQTAGDRIKLICEAEEATFYQDEYGVIRFENRRKFLDKNTTVWTINPDDILDWNNDRTIQIINKCVVKGKPRKVGATQDVWTYEVVEEFAGGESKDIWALLDDPVTSFTAPAQGTDYTANTQSDGAGTDISSDISVTASTFTDTVKFTVTNNYGGTAYLTLLKIRGTPAQLQDIILEEYEDTDSVNKYDERTLTIDNDFINDADFAQYIARQIVRKYKDPLKRIRLKVRGIPHIQLKDKVAVYDQDLATTNTYRLVKIQGYYGGGGFEQILTLREITQFEADEWAVVGTTQVGSTTEIVGI